MLGHPRFESQPDLVSLFDKFAPLRASRSLGSLDAAVLKDLGLDSTQKFIEVTARGIRRGVFERSTSSARTIHTASAAAATDASVVRPANA